MNFINKLKNNQDITIEFVGDSITHGLNHCTMEETYVAKFAQILSEKFKDYSVYRYDGIVSDELSPMKCFDGPVLVAYKENAGKIDIIKNGIGGNTVKRALNRIDDFTGILANGKTPDIIFTMFGINDALKSDPKKYVEPEIFKENYKTLISEIRKRNPEAFLIIMSATYNDQSVDKHVEMSYELSKEENIPCIDLHKLWEEHYNKNENHFGQGDWLYDDCDACHPTPKAAYIMAERIFEEFIKIINL